MALVRRGAAVDRSGHAGPAARPDALMWAAAVMIWTNVWRIQDLLPGLSALKLNLVAGVVAIGLFAIDRQPVRRLAWLRSPPILICGLVLLGIAIVGVPVSLYPRRSATWIVRDFVPNLLIAGMIAASARGLRDLEWIALVNVLGACAFSLFTHFRFGVGPDGHFGDLVYYDANDLALVLVCTIPFAIVFLVRRAWPLRVLALGGLALFVVTIGKTDSRGGLLGLMTVLGYMLVAYRAIPGRIRVLAIVAGIGAVAVLAGDAYWQTLRTLREPQGDYNWSGRSSEGRMAVWKRGLRYMADDPVLGVGLRNFQLAEGMLSEESKARAERGAGFKWSVAHNSFLEIGVELGVIALGVFVAMLAVALHALGRLRSARPLEDRMTHRVVALACTVSASFVGFIVSGFFISAAYFSYLYLLLGLTMGFAKLHRLGQLLPSTRQRRHIAVGAATFPRTPPRTREAGGSPLHLPRPRSGHTRFQNYLK